MPEKKDTCGCGCGLKHDVTKATKDKQEPEKVKESK
jgi:hypothetical protein